MLKFFPGLSAKQNKLKSCTGFMVGYSDPDPSSIEDNVIHVSEDFCRIVTMLDKMGKLD